MRLYQITKYLVGGYVRDQLLGVRSKDMDYTVVVDGAADLDEAWEAMKSWLIESGYKIFLETKAFMTIRAQFPLGTGPKGQTADFVLARAEGPYSDSRHPDWVNIGSLEDDLARRDLTINALAQSDSGEIIDLFNGLDDLKTRTLRAVGNPRDRLVEDPLRAFRAFRFAVTKGFTIHHTLTSAIKSQEVMDGLESVSTDRIRDELHRMFAYDTVGSVLLFVNHFPQYLPVLKQRGIWLEPTTQKA
jgi:tRNA nucleotidyltransferase (CCA-adding enzyme)